MPEAIEQIPRVNRRNPLHRRLLNFLSRPWADIWLVAQVYVLLGVTRLLINTLSFAKLEPYLGKRLIETSAEESLPNLRQARKIAWAIRAVSPYTPWTSNCFPQALTAKILLRRRGIPSTLYMGAAFERENHATAELQAHAWLRCGPIYVTGGNGGESYATVVAFGE